eukprot:241471-Pyramimonas_sp.AAC.1
MVEISVCNHSGSGFKVSPVSLLPPLDGKPCCVCCEKSEPLAAYTHDNDDDADDDDDGEDAAADDGADGDDGAGCGGG